MKDKEQEKQSADMRCKMVYDVFISYRRATGVNDARLLQQALKARGYNVFFDYDSLRVGKFNEKIFKAIESAPVFILMLTEGSLDACVKEGDWVRAEIEHALDHGRQIIPVTTSVQTLSFPDNLPPKLKDIPYQQVSEMNKTSLFEESIDKIIEDCFPEELKLKRQTIADGRATQVEVPESNAVTIPFSRLLATFLDQWLPWQDFRLVAGIEFLSGDGDVRMICHAVGSPWGIFLVGFSDRTGRHVAKNAACRPSKKLLREFAYAIADKCEIRRSLVFPLFAIPAEFNKPGLPDWVVVSESGVLNLLKRYEKEREVLNWKECCRDITRSLEALPLTCEGRERNILKHFNAGTAEELEDGAALLAWVDDPSEKLLDAAEMARYRLLDIQAWRSVESIKSWFRVMSDRGNVIAMDHYGWMLVDSEAEERVYWFRKAAELGGAHAQNSLGYCLHEGLGVEMDRGEALHYFRLSAEQGNRFGQESLARAYYEPDFAGLPPNPVEAFRLLTLSAGQGWHWSQFHLGECYEKGFGTNPDMAKARHWYEQAAKAGNENAKAALERLKGK